MILGEKRNPGGREKAPSNLDPASGLLYCTQTSETVEDTAAAQAGTAT